MVTVNSEDYKTMYGNLEEPCEGTHLYNKCSCACNCSCHCNCACRCRGRESEDELYW
jgi:hypothetical protein